MPVEAERLVDVLECWMRANLDWSIWGRDGAARPGRLTRCGGQLGGSAQAVTGGLRRQQRIPLLPDRRSRPLRNRRHPAVPRRRTVALGAKREVGSAAHTITYITRPRPSATRARPARCRRVRHRSGVDHRGSARDLWVATPSGANLGAGAIGSASSTEDQVAGDCRVADLAHCSHRGVALGLRSTLMNPGVVVQALVSRTRVWVMRSPATSHLATRSCVQRTPRDPVVRSGLRMRPVAFSPRKNVKGSTHEM